jgi:CyaY protein
LAEQQDAHQSLSLCIHGFYFINYFALYNRILNSKSKQVKPMNDVEYDELTDQVLLAVEDAIEALDLDLDYESHGGLLSISFPDGSKVIINKQPPLHQLWVATKFNGHHFELKDGVWIDNRTGAEFWTLLSDAFSKQSGQNVKLADNS